MRIAERNLKKELDFALVNDGRHCFNIINFRRLSIDDLLRCIVSTYG